MYHSKLSSWPEPDLATEYIYLDNGLSNSGSPTGKMSPSADVRDARYSLTATSTAVPKGFHVRVHRGPTLSSPPTATAQFDVGYYAMPRAESQEARTRYPSSSSQHVPISFPVSNAPTKTPQSKLVDSTAANRGYESDPRSTTPSYSIYQSSGDTYIYEPSNSSKSDLYSHSEFEQSTTTSSPSSFFSSAMSTDSLTTLKSPATTDTSLPDRSSRPATPFTTSRGPFRSVLIPGLSQAHSALKGIFRAPASQDHQSPRTSAVYKEHATTRPSRASSPSANSQDMPHLIVGTGPTPSGSTPTLRLSTIPSPLTIADVTPSPTTPLSTLPSPMYAPSTVSELELLERDRIARANAEYNSASSTSPYFRQRRNSILVSAPVPPNRTGSSTNGRPYQIYPSMPLHSSPEQLHANVASTYTVGTGHAAGPSSAEAATGSTQRPSPAIAPLQHARLGELDDTILFQPDESIPRRSRIRDDERRRSPETGSPSVVPQLINEGPHHGRYVRASRTMPPLVSQPAASLRPSHAAGPQPPSITEHDGYGSNTMQRERATSIRSQQRVEDSLPAPVSSPRGPRDAPPSVSLSYDNTPPRSHEHRREEPRAGVGEHQHDRSRKYPRTSSIPNERGTTVTTSNLPPGGTRVESSSRTAPEQTGEITPQYYTHRTSSKHVSPTVSPSRPGTIAVPGYHSSTTSPSRLHLSQRSYDPAQEVYASRDLDRPRSPLRSDYPHVQGLARHASHVPDSLTSLEHPHPHPPSSLPHPPHQTVTENHVHVRDSHHQHRQRRSRASEDSADEGATPARARLNSSTFEPRSRPNYSTPAPPPPTSPTSSLRRGPSAGGTSPEQRRQSTSDQSTPHHTSAPQLDQSHTHSREGGRYADGRTPLTTEMEMGETNHHSSFYTADPDPTTTHMRTRPLIYPSDTLRPSTEPRRRLSDGDATPRNRFPTATPHRRSSDGDRQLYPRSSTPLNFLRTVRWTENLVCPSPISSSQRRKGWFNRRGDQLWTNSGAYMPPAEGEEYPRDLGGYPEPGEGWMNEEGVRIDMGHHLIPKAPLRSALKQAGRKM